MSRIALTPSVSASLTASLVVAFAILSLAVLAAVVASLIKASFSVLERLVAALISAVFSFNTSSITLVEAFLASSRLGTVTFSIA